MSIPELLPCPFCGEKRIFLNEPSKHHRYGSINCPACLVCMPGEVRDQNELVFCWNERSGAPAQQTWMPIDGVPPRSDAPMLLYFPAKVTGAYKQNVSPAMYRTGHPDDFPHRAPSHFMLLEVPAAVAVVPEERAAATDGGQS